MSRRALALAGLVVVAVFFVLWWRNPERAIHRRLDRLEELMTKEGPEEQIAAWGTAREVGSLFAPGFVVLAEPYEAKITDLRRLVSSVHRYRTTGRAVGLVIGDREIEIRDDTAESTFVATVTLRREGRDPARESYRIVARWQREDGEWLIGHLALVEVLEGPAGPWW